MQLRFTKVGSADGRSLRSLEGCPSHTRSHLSRPGAQSERIGSSCKLIKLNFELKNKKFLLFVHSSPLELKKLRFLAPPPRVSLKKTSTARSARVWRALRPSRRQPKRRESKSEATCRAWWVARTRAQLHPRPSPTWRPPCSTWAVTRCRSGTPSASAPPAPSSQCSRL
jgi:hypothetical protein